MFYITDENGNPIPIAGNFNPSYNVSQLVKEVMVTTTTQSIFIDNLDIIRDGGVYDFVLEGCNSTTQESIIYIRFNEKDNARYFGSLIANYSSAPYGGTDNSVSQARIGVFAQNPSLVTGTISFPMSCPLFNSISFDVQSTIQVALFAGGYYDNLSNITSIRFNNPTTFAVGTKVKIYKRMANINMLNNGQILESAQDSQVLLYSSSGITSGTITLGNITPYKFLVFVSSDNNGYHTINTFSVKSFVSLINNGYLGLYGYDNNYINSQVLGSIENCSYKLSGDVVNQKLLQIWGIK